MITYDATGRKRVDQKPIQQHGSMASCPMGIARTGRQVLQPVSVSRGGVSADSGFTSLGSRSLALVIQVVSHDDLRLGS